MQKYLLGKHSPLETYDQTRLFNTINSRKIDAVLRPLEEEAVKFAATSFVGGVTGRAVGWGLGKIGNLKFFNSAKRIIPNAFNKVGVNLNVSSSKELLNFSTKAAEHMLEKERTVPIQILQQAIKYSKGKPDQRGSKALLHTIEMWKNGKPYNLEVLYDEASNSIWHFKYYH